MQTRRDRVGDGRPGAVTTDENKLSNNVIQISISIFLLDAPVLTHEGNIFYQIKGKLGGLAERRARHPCGPHDFFAQGMGRSRFDETAEDTMEIVG